MNSDIAQSTQTEKNGKGLFAGHPAGLQTLYFTEMWERFSYYGMRAILVLYMVAKANEGGLGFSIEDSTNIYGTYTMLVYMSSIPGGLIADKLLGFRLCVFIGGIIIMLGHFTMAFPSIQAFYGGLALIIIGTGMLKPNISSMVGNLYAEGDKRRDSGFSIFYMGVNVGGAISPVVCGFLAQSTEFKSFLASHGFDPLSSWHFGFAAAGFGMMLGLTQYVLGRKRLAEAGSNPNKKPVMAKPESKPKEAAQAEASSEKQAAAAVPTAGAGEVATPAASSGFSLDEMKRIGAILVLFVFSLLFWTIYEQGGSSLNVFTTKLVQCRVFGWNFPSSWLQSFQAVFVIVLAPMFSVLWLRLGKREPSSPAKFCYGLLFLAIGISFMVPAAMLAQSGKVSFLWLVFVYLFEVVGELCLSPVGLSTVTKLAPLRLLGLFMGVWYLNLAFGNKLAGFLAGKFNPDNINAMVTLYGGMAVAGLIAAAILAALVPTVKKLMTGVH